MFVCCKIAHGTAGTLSDHRPTGNPWVEKVWPAVLSAICKTNQPSGVWANLYNSSPPETESGGLLRVLCQLGLHSETLSLKRHRSKRRLTYEAGAAGRASAYLPGKLWITISQSSKVEQRPLALYTGVVLCMLKKWKELLDKQIKEGLFAICAKAAQSSSRMCLIDRGAPFIWFAVISRVLRVDSFSVRPENIPDIGLYLDFSETFPRPCIDARPTGHTIWECRLVSETRTDRECLNNFFWDSFGLSSFSLTWPLKEIVSTGSRNIAPFKERPKPLHHGLGRLGHRTPAPSNIISSRIPTHLTYEGPIPAFCDHQTFCIERSVMCALLTRASHHHDLVGFFLSCFCSQRLSACWRARLCF